MDGTTLEDLHKINTMKLIVTFFKTKLEDFVFGTNVTDDDLLLLLSHLTDCIQDFVSVAKVIKTNHQIASVADKNILSCENIFECLACKEQTGKTYSSVLKHTNTAKHISNVKNFELHIKLQPASYNTSSTASSSTLLSPIRDTTSSFQQKNYIEMNSNLTDEVVRSTTNENVRPMTHDDVRSMTHDDVRPMTHEDIRSLTHEDVRSLTHEDVRSMTHDDVRPMTHDDVRSMTHEDVRSMTHEDVRSMTHEDVRPMTNEHVRSMTNDDVKSTMPLIPHNPFPLLPNHLSIFLQQHRPPLPPLPVARVPNLGMPLPYGFAMNPMQSSTMNNFSNGINTPVNGFMKNYNQVPPPQMFHDYKGLFQMPQPNNVLGYQQKVPSSLSDCRQNVNQTNVKLVQPVQPVQLVQPVQPAQLVQSVQPVQPVVVKRRSRSKRKTSNNPNCQVDGCELKLLTPKAIKFLRENFEHEVMEFINDAKILTLEDLYDDIKEKLIEGCKEINLKAEVKCFGSRINGIGTYKSDIDLNVSVPDCTLTADNFLIKLAEVLPAQGCWTNGEYIKSRVSLIRACYGREINCDVTFNNKLAMANTKLIQYFYSLQPECRKLVVFIRMLAEKVNLYPQINTYTINLLVFFYFQNKGYLPKVMDLIETSSLEYWPNEFTEKPLEELNIPMSETFYDLCVGFTDFYLHNVHFENDILSTFTGSTINKHKFGLNESHSYYDGLLRYFHDKPGLVEGIKTSFRMVMCVQDPFSHDHNVSRLVGKSSLRRFKELCEDVHKLLQLRAASEKDSF